MADYATVLAENLVKEYESYEISGFVPMTDFGLYALFTFFGERVGKYEKRVVKALDGVSFVARSGEIVGVLGPNGSGKTTLLKVLAGLTIPTSGKAVVAGLDVVRDHEKLPRVVTYVPGLAAISLFTRPEMTVEWNLKRFADLAGLTPDAVREALERVELLEDASRRVGELSTGKLARLAIAFGLIKESQVYLMDEPFSGVSPEVKNRLLRMLKELANEGATILYATHILSEAEQVCDRVLILHNGRVIANTTPSILKRELELFETVELEVKVVEDPYSLVASLGEKAERLLKSEVEEDVLKMSVVTSDSREFIQHAINRVLAGNNKLLYVRVREPTLEDAYLSLLSKYTIPALFEHKVKTCYVFTAGG